MKQNVILYLVLVFLTISCTKENITTVEEAPSQLKIAQDYLLQSKSILLFAKLELNHETNRINGFLIDKKGDTRIVFNMRNHGLDLSTGYISDHVMRELLNKSVKTSEIDLSAIELVYYTKKAARLVKTSELVENTPTVETTHLLLNFSRDFSHEMPASCGPGTYDHGPSHHQTVISAQGRYNFDNNAVVSPNLADWLNSLQNPVEVPDTN